MPVRALLLLLLEEEEEAARRCDLQVSHLAARCRALPSSCLRASSSLLLSTGCSPLRPRPPTLLAAALLRAGACRGSRAEQAPWEEEEEEALLPAAEAAA